MTNLRQIQDQIDSYVSKVQEKSLELEELRKRLVELSDEVNGSGDLAILVKEAG
jgi:regulator of replication initiation timing